MNAGARTKVGVEAKARASPPVAVACMLQTYWTTSWSFTPKIRQDLNSRSLTGLALRRWGSYPTLPNSVGLRSKVATEIVSVRKLVSTTIGSYAAV